VVRDASTNSCLREHRKQRFEPTVARHSGRLVKLPGDGALVEFSSGLRDEPENGSLGPVTSATVIAVC
jgi:class 3 adenylate cyclase